MASLVSILWVLAFSRGPLGPSLMATTFLLLHYVLGLRGWHLFVCFGDIEIPRLFCARNSISTSLCFFAVCIKQFFRQRNTLTPTKHQHIGIQFRKAEAREETGTGFHGCSGVLGLVRKITWVGEERKRKKRERGRGQGSRGTAGI